ncbi:MAG: DMT family transporter [Acidobacteriota bacterium]
MTARLWRADLALVAVSLIWGATFVVVKEALRDSSTLLFLSLRFTLATLALGLVFRPLPSKFAGGGTLVRGGLLAGACLFGGYVLQTVGLRYTTPSKSAFLTGLSIVLVPVLGALVRGQAPRAREALGIAAATLGMGLMTFQGSLLRMNRGDLLTLACAVAFAVHILVVGHYAPRFSFQALTLVQIATAAALASASFWWAETPQIRWRPGVILALIVTGLLATALAFAIQAWAQQYTTPNRTALIFALEPVFAWLTSFLLTGELLSPRASAGAVLILAGILLVELKRAPAAAHLSP